MDEVLTVVDLAASRLLHVPNVHTKSQKMASGDCD